ncbi:MAG: TerB family tellurite resistance protein, partial [Pseudomonadota bacterium]
MLQAINDWFQKLSRAGEGEEPYPAADPKLSVAAILVHIIAVDGVVTEDEKRGLREVLARHSSLGTEEAGRGGGAAARR